MIDIPQNNTSDHSMKGIGKTVYTKYCIACHGPELKGNAPAFPSLIDINKKYSAQQVSDLLKSGRNMMPSFQQMSASEKEPLLAFLFDLKEKEPTGDSILKTAFEKDSLKDILEQVPYVMTGYNRFLDNNGYPGIKPPWGTLNAVDLVSGKLLWKVPLGEYPELTKKGIPPTGTENYGGSVVTKGGLVFIAATKDAKIRAFDKKTGEILWEGDLPVPGYATPSVYTLDGKQYVVIACGGGKIGSPSGDSFIAFSLPNYQK
jgi:quinoprotein glucose dehydrogenase